MTFGGDGWWKVMGDLGQDSATDLVKRAFDAGVNFIDTANIYSLGGSETLTGNAIKALGFATGRTSHRHQGHRRHERKSCQCSRSIAIPSHERAQCQLGQLKIDQNFVKNILSDPNDSAIAKMVIALANSLGLMVIAEGMEIEAQRDFLAHLGCHAYQGFLLSRPLPIEQLEGISQSTALWHPLNRRH